MYVRRRHGTSTWMIYGLNNWAIVSQNRPGEGLLVHLGSSAGGEGCGYEHQCQQDRGSTLRPHYRFPSSQTRLHQAPQTVHPAVLVLHPVLEEGHAAVGFGWRRSYTRAQTRDSSTGSDPAGESPAPRAPVAHLLRAKRG